MSELNHELDRDNLNKAYDETAKDMAKLLFPDGRKRYVEELDQKIELLSVTSDERRERSAWWGALSEASTGKRAFH